MPQKRRLKESAPVTPIPSANSKDPGHKNYNKLHYTKDESWSHFMVATIYILGGLPLGLRGLRWWQLLSALCGMFCGLFITKMVENAVILEYYTSDQITWLCINGGVMLVFGILFYVFRKNFAKWMTGSFAAATLGKKII
jgi:peptidoglycan/LPS O-acetylase OafA/YrhL